MLFAYKYSLRCQIGTSNKDMKSLIPSELIQKSIHLIRGQRVMLDVDLAKIYSVSVKALNQAVKRNKDRFPHDFCFLLNYQEVMRLRSQFVTLEIGSGGRGRYRKYLPYVFTEHGAVMLANVLKSRSAVRASIQVVRAFIKLKEMISTNKKIMKKFAQLEHKISIHDVHIHSLFDAIRQLMTPPSKPKRKIGFVRD